MNLFPLSKQFNTFDGDPLPSASPHLPARVRVAGECEKHQLPLFKLSTSKTVCACDGGCVFQITKGGLIPQGGY